MCTGITLKAKDGSIVQGRTLEFAVRIDQKIAVVPRGWQFVGKTPLGEGMRYQGKYAALGAVAFKDVALMDGVNEKGLCAGSFYFPTFAGYAEPTPRNQAMALSPVDFPNWILTQFASCAEVRTAVENGSAEIVPTVLEGWGPQSPPMHYIVHDRSGENIVIEPIGGRLVVHDDPLGVITNSPPFDWHMINLRNYVALDPRNVPPVTVAGEMLAPLGQGSGMLGLPGDFTPVSRFVRAAVFSATAEPSEDARKAVLQAFHILNDFDIPVGVAREEQGGVVYTDYTMSTIVRDPQALRFYYRTYDDQTIRAVDLSACNLDADEILFLEIAGEQPVEDMTAKLGCAMSAV